MPANIRLRLLYLPDRYVQVGRLKHTDISWCVPLVLYRCKTWCPR